MVRPEWKQNRLLEKEHTKSNEMFVVLSSDTTPDRLTSLQQVNHQCNVRFCRRGLPGKARQTPRQSSPFVVWMYVK